MTALDDAINSSSIVYGPHQIKAYWRESDLVGDGGVNADTPTNLTPQFTGDMVIEHSLHDGLPDPVTMTGSVDASGIMKAGLNGREGLTLASSGLRAYDGGGGSWDTGAATKIITAPIPLGIIRDDFVLAAVLIDDNTATVVQQTTDPKNTWEFLGLVADAPLAMYVYGKRRWRTGNPPLTLESDKNVDFMSLSIAFWARNPTDMALDYRVTDIQLTAESASVTAHTVTGTLYNKGYQVGYWGSATVGGITAGAGMTLHGDPAANGLVLMGASSPIKDSGVYTVTANQTPANAIMCKASISVEPYERPKMDARQYFSTFNEDSPVYGWDRDTADVLAAIRVLTATGPWDTPMFDGQMQEIAIQGRQAIMTAVSEARIWLNKSVTLPMVRGWREGATIDWIVTYLMARGGSFAGPAPNRYTRYWAPLYGSIHAHWETPENYNAAFYRESANPMLLFGLQPPRPVTDGRWLTAMFAQQTSTRQEELGLFANKMENFDIYAFPHLWDNGSGGPVLMDVSSLANSKGRLQFWLRGDPAATGITYAAASDDYLFRMRQSMTGPAGILSWVEIIVASSSRQSTIRMGNDLAGYTTVSFAHTALPTDGSWHFFGFHWDFAAGTAGCCYDGSVITANNWSIAGNNNVTQWPATDGIGRGLGYTYFLNFKAHLPMSDLLQDYGEAYVGGQWAEHYPTPKVPGANAIIRATNIPVNAVALATAVNAWDTIAELAKNSVASFRCDESDAFNFLPQDYFGETAQMTPSAVQDTTKNAADMDVNIDSSKIRNVVTVNFQDTRVDTQIQPVLRYLTSVPIGKGVTQITFPLDIPMVEIHGQTSQSGANWDIQNLTSSQITTPNLPKTNHYITVNTAADGSGTVLSAASVTAKIVGWDAMSVRLQFTNISGAITYLANNGDQVPFFQLMGYGVRISDGYTTARDDYSVWVRRERGLETEMNWLQTRAAAEDVAKQLAVTLSRPRAEVQVTVVGDPRRKPGQLVTLFDRDGTKVSGTWRVLAVSHNVSGAAYTQDLALRHVPSVLIWDDFNTTWDNSVWGE